MLCGALDRLSQHPQIKLLATSNALPTAPVGGPPGQGEFLNAAARLETSLSPDEILALLHAIEHQLGRARTVHWGPRTIDLDLLLYDDQIINTPELNVPHPLMHTRRFVLEPAAEIAAEWIHPVLKQSIADLLAVLPR
jgi:2-amino-4-hydroxy-6-hydroxymethyldihydropteridine diphosphokinase